jgi:hypothetical protein
MEGRGSRKEREREREGRGRDERGSRGEKGNNHFKGRKIS